MIDSTTADTVSRELVMLVKQVAGLRKHLPSVAPGVEHGSFPLLFTLSEEPRTVSALADAVCSQVSTVSRQVTGLEQQGLVRKGPDPDDRRAHRVELTEDGWDVVRRIREMRRAWVQDLLTDWERSEVDELLAGLQRLGRTLRAEQHRTRPRPTPTQEDA